MSVPPAILPETTCILKSGKMESVPMRLDILKRKNKKAILFMISIVLFLLSYRNCDRM